MGRNGLVTQLFKNLFGIKLPTIYGFRGIMIVECMQLYPLVFLYFSAALKNIDNTLLEASENMGCSGWKRFLTLVIPLCAPSIIAATLMVFMRAFADFGTPLFIGEGYKTFPVEIYNSFMSETGSDKHYASAVAVIAITPDKKMILVKQYRKAVEATSYEIPAGKLEAGEHADPKAAALRELEDETGYTGQLELIYDFYTAIGFCNEKIKLYKASNLTKVENPRPQDEDETLELFEVSLEEAHQLLQSGDICDAKTIMALQYWEIQENQR